MSTIIDDEFLVAPQKPKKIVKAKPKKRKKPKSKSQKAVEEAEEKLGGEVSTEDYKDENPPGAADPADERRHPFERMRGLTDQLETVITESLTNMDDNNKGSQWGQVMVAALRESRMLAQTLMPQWDEWERRNKEEKEMWVDYLLEFNMDYLEELIGTKVDDTIIEDYMDKWHRWLNLKNIRHELEAD